jgi:hypothetical protein
MQTGHVVASDLVYSDGMTEWVPVSQVLGNIPIPGTATAGLETVPVPTVPLPPNLPWPVLLVCYLSYVPIPFFKLISFLPVIWAFFQANWARKLSGKNTALVLVSMNLAGLFSGAFLAGIGAVVHTAGLAAFGGLLILAGAICLIAAAFSITGAMEEYYNTVENIGLNLSGAMTFFFNVIYIQYHVNRIARMKQSGEIA